MFPKALEQLRQTISLSIVGGNEDLESREESHRGLELGEESKERGRDMRERRTGEKKKEPRQRQKDTLAGAQKKAL